MVLTYIALIGQGPVYLQQLFTEHCPPLALRSKMKNLPHTHPKPKRGRALRFLALRLWDSLPLKLHLVDSIEVFQKQLKTFY